MAQAVFLEHELRRFSWNMARWQSWRSAGRERAADILEASSLLCELYSRQTVLPNSTVVDLVYFSEKVASVADQSGGNNSDRGRRKESDGRAASHEFIQSILVIIWDLPCYSDSIVCTSHWSDELE